MVNPLIYMYERNCCRKKVYCVLGSLFVQFTLSIFVFLRYGVHAVQLGLLVGVGI